MCSSKLVLEVCPGGEEMWKDERRGAPGLDTYKTSASEIGFLAEEARLKRLRHAVITTARLMEEQRQELQKGGFRYDPWMTGFTYRPGEKWSARDLSAYLEKRRKDCHAKGEPFVYCWVAEIQPRRVQWQPGETCLHYHLMEWVRRGMTPPKPDKRGWWLHGSTSREPARNPIGYLAKYASKGGCMEYVPSGARMCGSGGLTTERRRERLWWMCPAWLRAKWGQEHRPKRAEGGGWVSRLTGEVIKSPWRMVGIMRDVGWTFLRFEIVGVT